MHVAQSLANAGNLHKNQNFYILLNFKNKFQKTPFYRFYFFLGFYFYDHHMCGQI